MTERRLAPMTRTHGSGSLSIRQTKRDGPVFYAQFWVKPGEKVARRIGPVRQPGSKAGLTATQAEAALRKLMAETKPKDKPDADGGGIRFPAAGKVYLTHLRRQGRKKATLTAVESCLRVWAVPCLKRPLDRVTFEDVEALVAKMEAQGLSAKSVGNYIGTISAIFKFGMGRRGWCSSNPVKDVVLPAVERGDDIRFLEPEQVDALIRAVPDMTGDHPNHYAELDRVLYRTAAMTGMRQGELVALRWGAIDWPARKIRVRRSYVLGVDSSPKSQRSKRAVPMADEVASVLAAFQPHDATDDDLVFADPVSGGYLSNAAILRRFRVALKLAGLPAGTRFHDLRHTFATRVAASGVAMRTLQAWMGHASIQTTMIYADYAPSDHEAELVEAAFARPEIPEAIKETT